jgi:RimJ/RimL family protein N-acetyltransferase
MSVYLRAFESDDLALMNRWHNDAELNSMTGGVRRFVSSEYDREWLKDKMMNNADQLYWAICLHEDDRMIGYIAATNFDWVNRTAIYHALMIGDADHRNINNSLQATQLMMDYLFLELGFHRVYGYQLKSNSAALMLTRMAGFVQEGVMREAAYKQGEYVDMVLVSCLRDEYLAKRKN